MAVVAGAVSAVLGALAYTNSLVGEGWTRYFILLAGLSANQVVGDFTGVRVMEGLISSVVSWIFGFQIVFPQMGNISSLTVLFVIAPLIFFTLKFFIND